MRIPTMPVRVLRAAVALAVATVVLVPAAARGSSREDPAPHSVTAGGCARAGSRQDGNCAAATAQGAHILALARAAMKRDDLHAVLLSVWDGGGQIARAALGQSVTSQPATTAMHFRIGAVAIAYEATVLLKLVDEKRVSLDDPVSKWLPSLPHARQITLADLIESRSGYYDYEKSPQLAKRLDANPFQYFSQQYLIRLGVTHPMLFKPGTGFSYAHTNFVILGQVLAKITGQPLARLIKDYVLSPLGLANTDSPATPAIRPPVLEAYDSERGVYEDSTYWNPSWTLAAGAIMTSDITDLARTAIAIGSGTLLSRASYRLMIKPWSLIPGSPQIYFGMGVILDHSWVLQTPSFGGYNAVMAYLPAKKIAIAVATTLGPKASPGTNYSIQIMTAIGKYLAPGQPPSR